MDEEEHVFTLEEFASMNLSYLDFDMPSYTPGIKSGTSVKILLAITAWILAANVIFILTFLASRTLRNKPGHWLVFNLSCANLFVGLIVTPLAAYYKHLNKWILGTNLCITWLFSDVFLACVSIFSLIMINIDRLVFIRNPIEYNSDLRKAIIFVMVSLSWLGAATVVVPLYFVGHRGEFSNHVEGHCLMELSPEYAIGIAIGAFFTPVVIILCLTIAIMYAIQTSKSRLLDGTIKSNLNSHGQFVSRSTTFSIKGIGKSLITINLLFIAMYAPYYIFSTLISSGGFSLVSPTSVTIAIWSVYCNSGITPLLWMILPDIRRAFKRLICCKRCRQKVTAADSQISNGSSEQTFMLHNGSFYD